MIQITIIAAFIAGIASFLSPCVLPLVPAFLGYLAGISLSDTKSARVKIFLNTVAYVLGFSIIFAALGILLNTVLQDISYTLQQWLSRIGGIIIILFGLYVAGLIKCSFLERERTLKVKKKFSITYVNSFILGAAFAVGWTPCVGAVLGSVYALAISNPSISFLLLIAYSLGLGIPFLLVGLFSTQAIALIKKSSTFLKYFNIVVGLFLIILGVLVFTQTLNLVANLSIVNKILLK